jgi:hypothetical protein
MSSQGMLPTKIEDHFRAPEPTSRTMNSPINNAMSLLSLGEDLKEHIASTTVAITQVATSSPSFMPSGPERPGTPGTPREPGGPGGGGPGNTLVHQNTNTMHNGMKGAPPMTFEGNKKKYLTWKTELKLYHITNCNHTMITNSADRVLNTLGFIRGQDIASWVDDQILELDQKIVQWGEEDPRIWEDFKRDMDQAFKDVHTKDNAITQLMELRMTGLELDVYNTQFNQLLRKCGWKHNEEGTMQMYCRGLTAPLLRRMLEQDNHPNTLNGWQDLAIKYQGKWLEAQQKLAQWDTKDPNKQKAYLMKLINQKQSGHIHPEDHMDVDITEVLEECKEKQVCFYCQKPGHIKKDCRKRLADEARGRRPQTQTWQVEVVDEDKEDTLAGIKKNVKAMKDAEQRDLLAVLVDENF